MERLFNKKLIRPGEIFVAGGGSKNLFLMSEIVKRCRGIRVVSTEEVGIPVQFREAIGFALLAWWHTLNKPCVTSAITGAKKPSDLGIAVNPY